MSMNSEHHYHCPLDGTQLVEATLGILACPKCEMGYVPTCSEDGEASLIWKFTDTPVAQSGLEQRISTPRVEGSNPSGSAIDNFSGKYEFLSNFHMAPIQFMGETWPSTEHAFQAFKSNEKPIRDHIRGLSSPGQAKRAGRRVPYRKDWPEIRQHMMKVLIRLKFMQNTDLAEKLLATGDKRIVEGNCWHDNDWGDCGCEKCKDRPGENMLGEMLMELREELRALRIFECRL